MTDTTPVDADRPEPVINAAKLGGLVAASVVAIGGVVALVAAGRWGDLNALGATIGAAVTAVATLTAYVAPVWNARQARSKVTPLADPRDATGRPLVTVDSLRADKLLPSQQTPGPDHAAEPPEA